MENSQDEEAETEHDLTEDAFSDGMPETAAGSDAAGSDAADGAVPAAETAESLAPATAGLDAAAAEPVAPDQGLPAHPAHSRLPGDTVLGGDTGLAGDSEEMSRRWSAIQSSFVDDPRGSVADAASFLQEAMSTLAASIEQRERELRGQWDHDGLDTEDLRNILRTYRGLLDRIAAL